MESLVNPSSWPFELFVYFAKFAHPSSLLAYRSTNRKANDCVTHRLTWRSITEELVKDGPLAILIPATLYTLVEDEEGGQEIEQDNARLWELVKSCLTAARAQNNWDILPFLPPPYASAPRLRKLIIYNPSLSHRPTVQQISRLLTPGSRYLVRTDYHEQAKENKLSAIDIQHQTVLGVCIYPRTSRVLTFRVVDEGAAVMFLLSPEFLRT